jgi:hypothetical protein
LTDQSIDSAQHGRLASRVAQQCQAPASVGKAGQFGGLGDHVGNLPAKAVSMLVVTRELVGGVDERTHGAKAMRLAATRITLTSIGRNGFEAAQAAPAIGDDDACIVEHVIDKRLSHADEASLAGDGTLAFDGATAQRPISRLSGR